MVNKGKVVDLEWTLRELFTPPEGKFGARIFLCGMSGEAQILELIMESFSGEVSAARSRSGLLRGLLFLDPSQSLIPPNEIPGLYHIPPPQKARWVKCTSLLHAKVALLGFTSRKYGSVDSFRLIVSTGNWTSASFSPGGEIDLVWFTETDNKTKVDWNDCGSALDFFQRLLTKIYNFPSGKNLPDKQWGWIGDWQKILHKPSDQANKRFIHSLDQPLFGQIKKHFAGEGFGALVIGSGFYENVAEDQSANFKPFVLNKLEELGTPSHRYAVVNKKRAGALAEWFGRNSGANRWTACQPKDPMGNRNNPRTALHAKYIAGVQGGKRIISMYIGSGNLSKMGLFSCAQILGVQSTTEEKKQSRKNGFAGPGNIEAGVVFEPSNEEQPKDVWRALACGDEFEKNQLSSIEKGDEEILNTILDTPPILWFEQEDDYLVPYWAENETIAQYQQGVSWETILKIDTIPFQKSPPPVIRIRRKINQMEFTVPVFGIDGTFCREIGPPMSPEDVLQSIRDFPHIDPPESIEEGDLEPDGPQNKNQKQRKQSKTHEPLNYPLKYIMELCEAIAKKNEEIECDQFPVWLSHMRFALCEQVREQELEQMKNIGINPFPTLLRDGFAPNWLLGMRGGKTLQKEYQELLADIAKKWGLEGKPEPGIGE